MQRIGHEADAQSETRIRIEWVQSGDVFEKIRLPGVIEIHIGAGIQVSRQAEVLHLPWVVDAVASISAEVVRVHILHRQRQRRREAAENTLRSRGGP